VIRVKPNSESRGVFVKRPIQEGNKAALTLLRGPKIGSPNRPSLGVVNRAAKWVLRVGEIMKSEECPLLKEEWYKLPLISGILQGESYFFLSIVAQITWSCKHGSGHVSDGQQCAVHGL
jgi:hypothetical protein